MFPCIYVIEVYRYNYERSCITGIVDIERNPFTSDIEYYSKNIKEPIFYKNSVCINIRNKNQFIFDIRVSNCSGRRISEIRD
jgi:hypothetical protein